MTDDAILGISCLGHDAAVAAVQGPEIRFASHAERYDRTKNSAALSSELIDDALAALDGPPAHVAFYERPWWKRSRQLVRGQARRALDWRTLPRRYLASFPQLRGLPIRYVDHHLSHAAGGYFTSPFQEAAVVVVDAIGEWNTVSVWRAEGRKLTKVRTLNYPHSAGLLYSAITQRAGFKPNEEEYILMGLAAFGEPVYEQLLEDELVKTMSGPTLRLRRNLHRGVGPDWHREIEDTENLAAAAQALLTRYLDGLFEWVARTTGSRNLVYSGGVALNCVYNSHLARQDRFDSIWIMPNPGDAGSSLGAALASRADWASWRTALLGTTIPRASDPVEVVDALVAGEVVGVAAGAAEFGPRALGNRSLLADPRSIEMKARVNRVKRREPFRPFAPAVLEEHAATYFDLPVPSSPYMQFVGRCLVPDALPAVCHVDGTSRVQTVTREESPNLHAILTEFHARTGCPVLLNTSLNIRGQPLVNSWADAEAFALAYGVRVL